MPGPISQSPEPPSTPRRVFILSTGADTGGAAIRVVEAFRTISKTNIFPDQWIVRSMVASDNYIHYPMDLPYSKAALAEAYDDADVIVLNNTLHGHDWYDAGQGKPTVVMHHGLHEGHFDHSLQEVISQAKDAGAVQIGSTVNLELYGNIHQALGTPGTVTWAPIPYDLDELMAMRRQMFEPDPTRVRIVHAPTDRAVKSTEALVKAVKMLQKQGFPLELLLVEHQNHAQTLGIKAKYADILVDQLRLGYGNNAIEAWGMGIPVIGGVSDHSDWRTRMTERFMLSESPTGLPFFETDEDHLAAALALMSASENLRKKWGDIGLTHVQRWHSQEYAVRHLSDIYQWASLRPTWPGGGRLSRRGRDHVSRERHLELLRAARIHNAGR